MLSLYNTLTRQKEVFTPITPGHVNMYVCGMTVYDYCHIGHARMVVVFDMVARWLRSSGYHVNYVRNITDIDDKIIKRAVENGEPIQNLTERFIAAMNEDFAALGVIRPDHEPKATEHVGGMQAIIGKLFDKGIAYSAPNGDVYYSVKDFDGYGKLSRKDFDEQRAGERVEVDPNKRDPRDFVLWKAAKADEPAEVKWDSPWGKGRPGWHIECSAMSCHHLGEHFDIHGGGEDLQFPHHENEIAQSEGAHGHQYVNYWLHNGFINVDNEKMSKSLGNFFIIRDVLAKFDAEVLRFFILRAHYRSPLNYSDVHLTDAKNALTRLYTTLNTVAPADVDIDWAEPHAARFKAAMDDDFATSDAMAVLFDLASEANRHAGTEQGAQLAGELKTLAGILGLLQREPQAFLQAGAGGEGEWSAERIEAAIVARRDARAAKNWAEGDRIRDELAAAGIVLEDKAGVTTWRRA
ncbi:cysteine--tRNA ligase [Chitinilyticum piscinae]|uniref:Cysteine--tRNA ligase n=1 Tax=Chitinilyticum piscinae TaxID=2866724 RepID=A0A8J7K279_9NEIS|nr:cysteine--tRNA ligase [Chitinilyticum piscinae]MBE9609667.1 cysteine--tRNA ligase [Chitinilyticum piscinae]